MDILTEKSTSDDLKSDTFDDMYVVVCTVISTLQF